MSNKMSNTFFSVNAASFIKNFIHSLIILTLGGFTSSAEHKKYSPALAFLS